MLVDLKKALGERDQAVDLVARSLVVDRERDSNVIQVALRLPSAALARRTISTLVDLYLRRHIEVQRDPGVRWLFDSQVAADRSRLQELATATEVIRDKWNLRSVTEQRTQLIDRLSALERGLDDQFRQVQSLAAQHEEMGRALADLPKRTKSAEVVEPSQAARALRQRIAELGPKRAEAANKYTEGFPLVKSIDAEIAILEKQLATQEASEPGPVTYEPIHWPRSSRSRSRGSTSSRPVSRRP